MKRPDRKVIQHQVPPTPKGTDTLAVVAEFYLDNDVPIGMVRLVIPKWNKQSLLGIAFKRARPECLRATSVRFFYA